MSRRKNRDRAKAGIIFRNGAYVPASAWERQCQKTLAELDAAAKKGMKDLATALSVIGRMKTGISATQRRGFWDRAQKGGKP